MLPTILATGSPLARTPTCALAAGFGAALPGYEALILDGELSGGLMRPTRGADGPGRAMRVSVLIVLLASLVVAPAARSRQRPAPPIPRALSAGEHLVVRVRSGPLTLRSSPAGAPLARVGPQALFGGPLVFGVVAVRGQWLGVTSQWLPNGRLGWVKARTAKTAVGLVRYTIDVALAKRVLEVRRDAKLVRRIRVAVGSPSSPTPTGRFAVAEKLDGYAFDPVYGCCILALTARQTVLPAGWDRSQTHFVAIHGGGGIGGNVSAGCLHAGEADLRYLMKTIPLGTPVVIAP